MKIQPNRLDRAYKLRQTEYEDAALRVLRSGQYILGDELKTFENELSAYIGTNHCAGLASGLDALTISLKLLGIGHCDEVIVQANTFIACIMSITKNNATPVFVEPDEYYNLDPTKIEAAITKRTKAILVVHLFGQASDMESIEATAKKHNLYIIEDCAQSAGAGQNKQVTGSFGDIGCFSFFPSKNLGGFGDGGAVTLNDPELAQRFRTYRNYGSNKKYHHETEGGNSRLDELQAALLRIRLRHLNEMTAERKTLCNRYLNEITNKQIIIPKIRKNSETVWHQFVIRTPQRDDLQKHLAENNIETIIHYPIPPHLSKAYKHLGYKEGSFPITEQYANTTLSLPLYIGMTEEEQSYVIDMINKFNK